MTRSQALKLKDDIGKTIEDADFCDEVYLSIKGVGAKVFKDCNLYEIEGWIFIWTREESFAFCRKDIGDFLMLENPKSFSTNLEK